MEVPMKKKSKLKVGVLGIRRGAGFAKTFNINPHTELVAICDFDKDRINKFIYESKNKNITVYDNYDKFLEHETDIVVIAGYCTDHAPQAVKALNAGKHVLSEVTACKTLAEGVSLCRAVEKSKKIYMLAENYCYFSYTKEMQKLYKEGKIGEYMYGECEYIHDCRPSWLFLTNGPNHWRNWHPAGYYCTHSIGPIITITNTRPVKVSGFVVPNILGRGVGRVGDDWGVLMCTMDNGALTRVISWSTGIRDSIWYRLYGTKGAMENNRLRDTNVLNLTIEKSLGKLYEKSYETKFLKYADLAKKAGHGGSDFFIVWDFVDAIINNKKPPIDVYQAMDMTLPGILGFRSACNGNVSLEVPDFRREDIRKKYENDNLSPDPNVRGTKYYIHPSILGEIKIPRYIYHEINKKREKAFYKLLESKEK